MSPSALAEELAEHLGIAHDDVVAAVTNEVMRRAKSRFPDHTLEPLFDEESGHLNLYLVFNVVSSVQDPGREVSLDGARGVDPDVGVGDELMFQILSHGEVMMPPQEVELDEPLERAIRALPEIYAQGLTSARDKLRA